jgi:hypothetical protein
MIRRACGRERTAGDDRRGPLAQLRATNSAQARTQLIERHLQLAHTRGALSPHPPAAGGSRAGCEPRPGQGGRRVRPRPGHAVRGVRDPEHHRRPEEPRARRVVGRSPPPLAEGPSAGRRGRGTAPGGAHSHAGSREHATKRPRRGPGAASPTRRLVAAAATRARGSPIAPSAAARHNGRPSRPGSREPASCRRATTANRAERRTQGARASAPFWSSVRRRR